MDYKKKYYELINTRKVLNRIKTPTDYFEKHHIVPLSLGGTNENDNLVLLTAKEHYIAHLLLVHCFYGKAKNKMIWALWGMQRKSKGQKRIMSASQYENARILFSNMVKNKIVSKETIQKRTKTRQENGWNKNPELTKKKQSEKGTKDFPKIAILNSIKTRQKAINRLRLGDVAETDAQKRDAVEVTMSSKIEKLNGNIAKPLVSGSLLTELKFKIWEHK